MVRRGDLGRGPHARPGRACSGAGRARRRSTTSRRTEPIRSIHVAGTLRFDPDRDTRLDVGLIKIQAGDDPGESGFDCESHAASRPVPGSRPERPWKSARPIARSRRDHTALIRLTLGSRARPGRLSGDRLLRRPDGLSRRRAEPSLGQAGRDRRQGHRPPLVLAEPVTGWRVGDRVIVTATHRQKVRRRRKCARASALEPETEERTIRAIDGPSVTLDAPLAFNACRHRRLIAAKSPT